MSAIELNDITKRYRHVTAVERIEFQVDAQQCCVLFGQSGAGKSTLLRIVAGLEQPTSGRVLFDGNDVTQLPPHKRSVAMVSQDAAVYPQLTVRQNMLVALRRQKIPRQEADQRVSKTMEDFGISPLSDRMPAELSGGEARRLSFARALVAKPRILLLDEPLSQLDGINKQNALELLAEVSERFQPTMLIVSHDPLDTLRLAQRVVVLHEGKVIDHGEPGYVYQRPRSRLSGQLLSPLGMNWLESDSLQIEPPASESQASARRFVGFRPEDAQPSSGHSGEGLRLTVDVHSHDNLGFGSLALARAGGKPVRFLVERGREKIGPVTIQIPAAALCWVND